MEEKCCEGQTQGAHTCQSRRAHFRMENGATTFPCIPGCRRKRVEILPMQAPGSRQQSGGGYGNKVKSGKRFPGTGKHGPREEKPAVFGRNGLIQPGRAVKTVRRHSLSMQGNVVGRCGRCVPESAPERRNIPAGSVIPAGPARFFCAARLSTAIPVPACPHSFIARNVRAMP